MLKWFVFFFAAWFIGSILSGIIEMSYMGSYGSPTIWSWAFNTFIQTSSASGLTVVAMPVNTNFITVLFNTFSWNFSFFTGDLIIIRWLLIAVLSGPMAIFFGLELASVFAGIFHR
jgi:hypothetical protein